MASELAEIHAGAVALTKEIDEVGEFMALLFKPTGEPLFLPELELFRIGSMIDRFSEDQIMVLRRILLLSPLLERLEEMQHYEIFVAAYLFPFSEIERMNYEKMVLRLKSPAFLENHVSPHAFSRGVAKVIEVRREMLESQRNQSLRPEMRVLRKGDLFFENDVSAPRNGEPTMTNWLDATIPQNVYFAIDGATLGEIGAGDRLWEELLAIKGIYGKTHKIFVTGKITGKATARLHELEAFGGQVFTEMGALRIPESAKIIYFTNSEDPADIAALPGRMGRNVKAVFRKLQKADFLTAVQLSLSSLLEEDLSRQINLRGYIAERLGFDAAHELGILFDAFAAITRAA